MTLKPSSASASAARRTAAATPGWVLPPGGSGSTATAGRSPGARSVKTAGTLSGSRGCWPAIAVKPARTSAIRRARTPSTAISWKEIFQTSGGITVARGTAPVEGLIDATPQQCAGLRKDPPRSLPRPSGLIPVARAAASPPLDPPAVRCGFHGLRVRPCKAESVCTRRAKSGRLVRPNGIARPRAAAPPAGRRPERPPRPAPGPPAWSGCPPGRCSL